MDALLSRSNKEMSESTLKNHVLKPAAIFRKSYVEGFFCPKCSSTLLRAENLEFITRNEEYWKCSECNLEMYLSDNGLEIVFSFIDKVVHENIMLHYADQAAELEID